MSHTVCTHIVGPKKFMACWTGGVVTPKSTPLLTMCYHAEFGLLLLLLRLAPLRVRSAAGRQQPPERSVLGQVDCVSQ